MSDEREENPPQGDAREWARRWSTEFASAKEALSGWQEEARLAVDRFRAKREDLRGRGFTLVNLFASTVQTQRAMLYGNTPRVSVERRFNDAQDDVARVSGVILDRVLNTDIEKDGDGYVEALQLTLEDRQLPGLGVARVRLEVETEEVKGRDAQVDDNGVELAPAVEATTRIKQGSEMVDTDYIPWQDFLYSKARVWREVRWIAFAADMSRAALVKRFGAEVGNAVPLDSQGKDDKGHKKEEPWDRARVWEIWDKEHKRVFWYVEGYSQTLDDKEDPLGLDGFFPCPRPMIANATTSALVPLPDYTLARDLYEEVDSISTRITVLEKAIRVAGLYDKSAGDLQNLLSESTTNRLYPVENWPAFSEKGGIEGAVSWLPLGEILTALTALRDYRRELMDLIFQVTGMSDIMRGQATAPGVTATEQSIKARFGSVRMQALQTEFARYATDLQRLKAEIYCKHVSAETLIARSNILRTPDAQLAPAAVQLLKERFSDYRLTVAPETLSITDFSALRQEGMEVLGGLATFLQATAPLATSMPGSTPFVLQLLQWVLARMRAGSEAEGIIDAAITAARQAPPPQQAQGPNPMSDPKVIAQQLKGQQDLAKIQAQSQANLMETQAEVAADAQREQNQALWNVREAAQKHAIVQAGRLMGPNGGTL